MFSPHFSDFAKIFGCLVGLPNELTAITLVAFGTSQIDLFASRIAAINDPTADNSIGNVVAANAIGVFLGQSQCSPLSLVELQRGLALIGREDCSAAYASNLMP